MRFFKCNESIKTYKIPIFKMLSSTALILLSINGLGRIPINHAVWDVIVRICGAVIVSVAIFQIYIAVAEMALLHDRKELANMDIAYATEHSKKYTVDNVITLLTENDVIEIVAILHSQIITMGAASNCHQGSSRFFDKVYYMNDKTFEAIDDFKAEIGNLYTDGTICIVSIDGIAP